MTPHPLLDRPSCSACAQTRPRRVRADHGPPCPDRLAPRANWRSRAACTPRLSRANKPVDGTGRTTLTDWPHERAGSSGRDACPACRDRTSPKQGEDADGQARPPHRVWGNALEGSHGPSGATTPALRTSHRRVRVPFPHVEQRVKRRSRARPMLLNDGCPGRAPRSTRHEPPSRVAQARAVRADRMAWRCPERPSRQASQKRTARRASSFAKPQEGGYSNILYKSNDTHACAYFKKKFFQRVPNISSRNPLHTTSA